jgi:hypothetical protein
MDRLPERALDDGAMRGYRSKSTDRHWGYGQIAFLTGVLFKSLTISIVQDSHNSFGWVLLAGLIIIAIVA